MKTELIISIVVLVLASIGVIVIIISCAKSNVKEETKTELVFTNWIEWKSAEAELLRKINEYRVNNELPPISSNDDMKNLADKRTAYWKKMVFTKDDNLHRNFLRDRQPYLDKGWLNISENASLGYRKVFIQWAESDSHNRNMLSVWTYAGVSIIKDFNGKQLTCLILGK